MALNTQEIFDVVSKKYSATSQNDSFVTWFWYAMTRIESDLASPRCGVSITFPTDLDTDIDCDDHYFGVIVDGLNKYIQESGMWGSDDKQWLEAQYARSLAGAKTYYETQVTVETRLSSTDADDE